jgi:uncharacterized protein YjbI with pentapeptide repeats
MGKDEDPDGAAPEGDLAAQATMTALRNAGPWALAIAAIVLVAVVQGVAGAAPATAAAAAVAVAALVSLRETGLSGARGRGLVLLAAVAGMAVSLVLTIIRDGGSDSATKGPSDDGLDLSHTQLVDAQLPRAGLAGADLSWAVVTGADLSGAILSDTCLSHTDLTGAVLDGATFTGADATNAIVDPAEAKDALDFPTAEESEDSTACD